MNLATIRQQKGLSQQELSRRSGVAQSVISNIEKGKTPAPRINTVLALAQSLGCTLEELVPNENAAGGC